MLVYLTQACMPCSFCEEYDSDSSEEIFVGSDDGQRGDDDEPCVDDSTSDCDDQRSDDEED